MWGTKQMLYPSWGCKLESLTATPARLGFLFTLSLSRHLYHQKYLCCLYQTTLKLSPLFNLHNDQTTIQKPTGKQGRTNHIWKKSLLKSYPCPQNTPNCPVINATSTIICSVILKAIPSPTPSPPSTAWEQNYQPFFASKLNFQFSQGLL